MCNDSIIAQYFRAFLKEEMLLCSAGKLLRGSVSSNESGLRFEPESMSPDLTLPEPILNRNIGQSLVYKMKC